MRWIACAGAACLALLTAISPASAAEAPSLVGAARGEWRVLTNPRFTIVSQLNETATLAWARQFDEFIFSASKMLNANVKNLVPTTIVLFGNDKTFSQYKPQRPDGKARRLRRGAVRTPSHVGRDCAGEDAGLRADAAHHLPRGHALGRE